MNAASCEQIAALVLHKLGLRVVASCSGGEITVAPEGYTAAESFVVRFRPAWRSADAQLVPGAFAGSMVRGMGAAGPAAQSLFLSYVAALERAGARVEVKINGSIVDTSNPTIWDSLWQSFDVAVRKTALVFDLNIDAELLPVADLIVVPLIGMAMALIGTENINSFEGEVEGAAIEYRATKYERKKINRDACIRIHGLNCAACGFNFEKFYGSLAEGYIEVHHVESIAETGEVLINPAIDLVPLCSNCHSAVHRVNPPLPVAELRRIIAERKI